MNILKALASLTFAFFISFNSNAQNFQGIATYHTATTLDMKMKVDSSKSNPKMDQRMAQMKKRMAEAMQKEYELKFDKSTSTYTEVETLEGGAGGRGGRGGMKMFASIMGGNSSYYKNILAVILPYCVWQV